ncbi:MAG: hypothetical protein V1900_01590 [Candidatus Aenigmatarchaeota archaeon]
MLGLYEKIKTGIEELSPCNRSHYSLGICGDKSLSLKVAGRVLKNLGIAGNSYFVGDTLHIRMEGFD